MEAETIMTVLEVLLPCGLLPVLDASVDEALPKRPQAPKDALFSPGDVVLWSKEGGCSYLGVVHFVGTDQEGRKSTAGEQVVCAKSFPEGKWVNVYVEGGFNYIDEAISAYDYKQFRQEVI